MRHPIALAVCFGAMVMVGAAGLVTAAVTHEDQVTGTHVVVLKNNKTGAKSFWNRKEFTSYTDCVLALGNLPLGLKALADPDPKNVPPPVSPTTDPELAMSVIGLARNIFQNTGSIPDLSLSCEPKGGRVS